MVITVMMIQPLCGQLFPFSFSALGSRWCSEKLLCECRAPVLRLLRLTLASLLVSRVSFPAWTCLGCVEMESD